MEPLVSGPTSRNPVSTKCEDCGETFEASPFLGRPRPACPPCQEIRHGDYEAKIAADMESEAEAVRNRWRTDGPPGIYRHKFFSNFIREKQPAAYDGALAAAKAGTGLFLSSINPGVGKTHLMAAIYHYIVDNWDGARAFKEHGGGKFDPIRPILFITDHDMFTTIRATYDRQPDALSEQQVINNFKSAPLLIIDDILKMKPADLTFAQRIYYEILDHRYSRGLPVYATAQKTTQELVASLSAPVMDRLIVLTGKNEINMRGQSQR